MEDLGRRERKSAAGVTFGEPTKKRCTVVTCMYACIRTQHMYARARVCVSDCTSVYEPPHIPPCTHALVCTRPCLYRVKNWSRCDEGSEREKERRTRSCVER